MWIHSILYLSYLIFCSCTLFVRIILFKTAVSCLLLYSLSFIVLFSFLLSVSFIVYVDRRLVRYLIAARLYSGGWQESLRKMISVAEGFLYMLNIILLSTLEIVMSRKLILLSTSYSIVKCIVGVRLLNVFNTSWIFVTFYW